MQWLFLADLFPHTLKNIFINTHKLIITFWNSITFTIVNVQREKPTSFLSLIICVIHARQMWEGTHTCCSQKIKLGPLYIIRYFNRRLKWEIWSICLVSLKDQEETTMSLLHAGWIKKLGKRLWRGHMETWWGSAGVYEQCHHQNADVLWRSQRCHITYWKIWPSPICWSKLLLRDFAAVTRYWDTQRAVQVVHRHSCIFLLALLFSVRWSCPAQWV